MPKDDFASPPTSAVISSDVVAPLAEITETTDAAGDSSTSYTVTDGDIVHGTREAAGDEDWYRIELEVNDVLTVSHESAAGRAGINDPYLYLYDADGSVIAQVDDTGYDLNSLLVRPVPVSGSYFIGADTLFNNDTGDYVLSVEVNATTPLSVGTPFDGDLEVGGALEYFSVELLAGRDYVITFVGTDTSDPLIDAYLTVYSGVGFPSYAFATEAYSPAQMFYSPDADGTFVIAAGSTYGDDGLFRLSVALEPPGDTSTEATLAAGDSINAGIETSGDQDWYGIELAADQAYAIRLASTGDGDPLEDPQLALYDSAGQAVPLSQIALGDGEVLLVLSGLAAGSYFVSAQSAASNGRGDYTLSMAASPVGDDTAGSYVGGPEDDVFLTGGGADTVTGGDGNDYIETGTGGDSVLGEGGRDVIRGSYGEDFISGGDGDDTIEGGGDLDTLIGGTGEDSILGGTGNDSIDGGDGDDFISADGGHDTAEGGGGHDVMRGKGGEDSLSGGGGNDWLKGNPGHDTLFGNNGDDTLEGNDGLDWLDGGVGNDLLDGGGATDHIDGGDGDDTIFGGKGSDVIDGGDGNDSITADGGHDHVEGGDGDDYINGKGGADTIIGGGGDDTFIGGGGADLFVGGNGADMIDHFEIGIDTIMLEDDFFAFAARDTDSLLSSAWVVDGNVVIYGDAGNSLTLLGLDTLDDLAASFLMI